MSGDVIFFDFLAMAFFMAEIKIAVMNAAKLYFLVLISKVDF